MIVKVSNSKERLAEMMSLLHIKAADICDASGINSASMSRYVNGIREPRQDALYMIAKPYGINPAWLMGLDVPMYQSEVEPQKPIEEQTGDAELLRLFHNATESAQESVMVLLKASQRNFESSEEVG